MNEVVLGTRPLGGLVPETMNEASRLCKIVQLAVRI